MNKQIIEQDKNVIMGTYGRFPIAIEKGKGAKVFDADGREYIDMTSGIGVASLGHCDEEWSKAVADQAYKLAHISNLYANSAQVALAEKLTACTGFDKVFFANSGAEANEGAIKLARKYSFDKYGKGRNVIVTMQNSFHGRTISTLSATGQEDYHNYFFPFTEGFVHASINDIEAFKSAITEQVCAVMLESIQGEGGVIPLEHSFAKEVFNFCKERDILVICDEVQTGIGRTGKMLACEHFDMKPDIVTLAKGLGGGLPIGAFLCQKELSGVMGPGTHGSTFGGNPICCAGALVVLNRVSKPEFLKSVKDKGEYIKNKLMSDNKGLIQEVRGAGLMIGALLTEKDAKAVVNSLLEEGVLALTAKNALRLLPPLTITYKEIDKALDILHGVLTK